LGYRQGRGNHSPLERYHQHTVLYKIRYRYLKSRMF
jgi:hypothetical protein